MSEDGTFTRDVHPHVGREVLSCEHDVCLGLCCSLSVLHAECSLMVDFSSVEHASHLEVGFPCQIALDDVLVEGDAQVVANVENTVGGLWLTERTRTHHILHHCYLIAVAIHLVVAISAGRDDAEQVVAIREIGHRQRVADAGTRRGQHVVVVGLVLALQHILAEQCPVGASLLLILYAESLQVSVVAVEA